MVLIPARGSAGWGQQPPPVRAPTIPHAQNHPLMSSWAIMYAPKSQPHPSLGHPETHNYSQNQTPTHLHTHDSKSHSHPGVTPFPIFLHFSSTPTPEHTHNLTPNGHTHTPKNCFHSHTSISKIRSHLPAPTPPTLPQLSSANGPELDTRARTPHRSHAQRARLPCTHSPTHPPFPIPPHPPRDRAGSCTPRPVFPAQLTGLSLEQKLQRGQKQAEANPRLDQTPATPHPGGPQKRRETSRCGCGARRLRRLGALARSGRLHSGSA